MAQGKIERKYSDGKSILHVNLSLIKYREGETFIVYSPAFDLIGYGNTSVEADSSFQVLLDEFIRYTNNKNTFTKELIRLGWQVSQGKKKSYKPPLLQDMLEKNKELSKIMNTHAYEHSTQSLNIPVFA